jgi:DNA-binding response OmpR family regulator
MATPSHKILLADDDPGVCQTLAMVLTSAGYDVSTAEHGIDAIFLLQTTVPDLIIFELNLPNVPGYDFLAVVRARYPRISVIAMSSCPALDGRVPEGVFADSMYIKGQSRPEDLLERVSQLLQSREARAQEHQKNSRDAFAANQRARRASVS